MGPDEVVPEGFELEEPPTAEGAAGPVPEGFEADVPRETPQLAKTRAALQGATFGFGDEAVAALVAGARQLAGDDRSFLDIYEDVSQNERDQIAQYREIAPVKAFLSEGAGALLTGGAAGSRLLARQGLKKLPRWLSTALVGGLEGTVYGAGAADPGKRVEGAAKTGAISFVATPALAGVAKVATKLVGDVGRYAIKRLMATPESEAVTLVREAAKQAGLKADDVVARYKKLGPDGLLLDTDENFRGLMRALADRFGPAKREARQVLEERQLGQVPRLVREIEDASGLAADDYVDSMRGLAQKRAQSSAPLYEAAFTEAKPSDAMLALAERPTLKFALARARKLAADEGEAAADLSFKQFHYAKMALDDKIGATLRAGNKNEARSLLKLKQELLQEMDEVSPDYRAARDLYAGDSALLEAADTGRKFYTLSLDEFGDAVRGLSQSELEMFKRGSVKAIVDKLGDSQLTYDSAKKLTNTPALQAKLSLLFKTPESATRFIQQVHAEREFTRSRTVVAGGSPTSQNLAAKEGVEEMATGAAAAVRGDALTAGLQVIGKIFGKKPPTPETIKEAADILLKRNMNEGQIRQLFKESGLAIPEDKITKAINAARGAAAPAGAAAIEAVTH